jgi:uncharacterized membrane protein YphA (DoxX/SURF4 family)
MASELALVAGRLIFAVYFVLSGINHFMKTENLTGWVEAKGLPLPEALVYFSGGQLVLGGALVALAFEPVIGIGALALFLLVATPTMHNFWDMEGEDKQNHQVNFLKNFALLGALLVMLGARDAVFTAPLV